MSSVPERSAIDAQYKWDLESIYATDEEWEEAYEDVEERLSELEAYEGQVTDDGETLLTVLQLSDELGREVSMVASYARMRSDEDTSDQEYQALASRAQSLASRAGSATSFIEPEIQSLDREELDQMIAETDGLETYEHALDDVIRMKEHTRSAEIENLLAEFGEVTGAPNDIYSMLSNADMTFPTVEDPDGESVEITQSNFVNLLKNPDREFRQTVYENYFDEWSDVRNAVGAAYKNSVKADVKYARARNYDTAREAALDGPNVPVDVYDNLLDTVRDNLDKLHRHAELKRRSLGVDELRMWDVYMPMTDTESPDLDYDQAVEYVVDAVGALGDDYQSRVAEGIESRWIDVYETQDKRSGAYSGGTYDTQPFILMNYQDDISSMYTLAHELGHSLHSQLTSESQPYTYSSYEIFVAEVASTVNEALLTHHLLETVEDPDFRRHVLNEYLERFRSTLYRQTLFADFEYRAHQLAEDNEALTPDRLDGIYGDLKREFYDPAVVDDRIEREWMRIPHFYRAYYVYQYSTGISAAVALADKILEEGEPAAERYLDFLSNGSREYPLTLLQGAGVDMSSPEPIQRALDVYGKRLDEMEELI
ncbi:oligoendopeptidase F [Haladaptatus paucihalophilus DX253]|uniref:Oligoendopeptidase F n=1 Tax=Haladaptatus paucihalophilus DX253 TaxID=797209 RepID=E7QP86_HALPU|nr:oligoendopeptidase F [Haladaptatus paucihalophilus]EFW94002.1 oligoendopeptidase F [Haladaptatus paucihalophilus DX253]SHK64708.1 oligopeptidase F. Metallo peptidase. MEROPS family M03B [Haladaptatus paucihalophilus DX253]